MQDELVSFKVAELAKKVGFNIKVRDFFYKEGDVIKEYCENYRYDHNNHELFPETHYSRPTQSLLQRWLRELFKIYVDVGVCTYGDYVVSIIHDQDEITECWADPSFSEEKKDKIRSKYDGATYEEAFEKGLFIACTLLKRLTDEQQGKRWSIGSKDCSAEQGV